VVYFKILSRSAPGKAETRYDKPQPGYLILQSKSEPWTSTIQIWRIIDSPFM